MLIMQQSLASTIVYRANRHSPIFGELAGVLRKTSGMADAVTEALEPFADRTDIAFIFGSECVHGSTQARRRQIPRIAGVRAAHSLAAPAPPLSGS